MKEGKERGKKGGNVSEGVVMEGRYFGVSLEKMKPVSSFKTKEDSRVVGSEEGGVKWTTFWQRARELKLLL